MNAAHFWQHFWAPCHYKPYWQQTSRTLSLWTLQEKKEHVILLLFVHFFPSHIGHHLLFIRNTTLTVKSHISNTQRGDNKLSGSAGTGRTVLWPLWRGPRTEVMCSGLRCLRELMLPFSEGSSSVPGHRTLHSTLALMAALVCLLNCLFLHSFIQQHASNHCVLFSGINRGKDL